jgi:hypothetical protein
MKSKFYKLSLILAVVSFVPFLIFISRRENPPPKVKIPQHRKQTVEKFILKSTGKNRWILRAPKATFPEKNVVILEKPVLTIFKNGNFTIVANWAKLFKEKNKVFLKNATLKGKNFTGFSPEGVYYFNREIFKTNSTCKLIYNGVNSIKGRTCTVDVKRQRVIIFKGARTVIKEVRR